MKMEIKELTHKELKELIKVNNLLPFNREISQLHVNKMAKSIEKCGLLRLPVIGLLSYQETPKMSIIDGQHLIKAHLDSKKGAMQVIVKNYDNKRQVINDIATLNNTQKTWNDQDYLEAWYEFGKDNEEHYNNYSYLHHKYNELSVSCGLLVEIYSISKTSFRDGTLEFYHRDFSDKVALMAHNLKVEYKKGAFTLTGLRVWCANRHKNGKDIDFDKLRSRLYNAIRNGEDRNCNGREDFIDFIEMVYHRV